MPRAKRHCFTCKSIHSGPCPKQAEMDRARKQANDRARGSASSRGYGSAWRKLAAQVLKEEPLCRCPEHRSTAADAVFGSKPDSPASRVVDHIIPHRGDNALFWDRANLQGMAKACHDRKTAGEDGGFGNPDRSVRPDATAKPDPVGHFGSIASHFQSTTYDIRLHQRTGGSESVRSRGPKPRGWADSFLYRIGGF